MNSNIETNKDKKSPVSKEMEDFKDANKKFKDKWANNSLAVKEFKQRQPLCEGFKAKSQFGSDRGHNTNEDQVKYTSQAQQDKAQYIKALFSKPQHEPIDPETGLIKYTEGIIDLCTPGKKPIDYNDYTRVIENKTIMDEFLCTLVRKSEGRIKPYMIATLAEALPKVTAQLFMDFREGIISLQDLKLASLGVDYTKFMSIQKLIDEAFPDEDIPFLTPIDIERRKIIIERMYAQANASAEGGQAISYEPIREIPMLVKQRQLVKPSPCFIKPKPAKKRRHYRSSTQNVSISKNTETFELKSGTTEVCDEMKGRIFSDDEVIDYEAFREAVRDYIRWDIRDGRDHDHGTLLSEVPKKAEATFFKPKQKSKVVMTQQERDQFEIKEQYNKVKDILWLTHYTDASKVGQNKWYQTLLVKYEQKRKESESFSNCRMTRQQHLKTLGLNQKKRPKQIIHDKTMKVRVDEQKLQVYMAIKRRFSKKKSKQEGVTTTTESTQPNIQTSAKLSKKSPTRPEKNIEELNTVFRERSVGSENELSAQQERTDRREILEQTGQQSLVEHRENTLMSNAENLQPNRTMSTTQFQIEKQVPLISIYNGIRKRDDETVMLDTKINRETLLKPQLSKSPEMYNPELKGKLTTVVSPSSEFPKQPQVQIKRERPTRLQSAIPRDHRQTTFLTAKSNFKDKNQMSINNRFQTNTATEQMQSQRNAVRPLKKLIARPQSGIPVRRKMDKINEQKGTARQSNDAHRTTTAFTSNRLNDSQTAFPSSNVMSPHGSSARALLLHQQALRTQETTINMFHDKKYTIDNNAMNQISSSSLVQNDHYMDHERDSGTNTQIPLCYQTQQHPLPDSEIKAYAAPAADQYGPHLKGSKIQLVSSRINSNFLTPVLHESASNHGLTRNRSSQLKGNLINQHQRQVAVSWGTNPFTQVRQAGSATAHYHMGRQVTANQIDQFQYHKGAMNMRAQSATQRQIGSALAALNSSRSRRERPAAWKSSKMGQNSYRAKVLEQYRNEAEAKNADLDQINSIRTIQGQRCIPTDREQTGRQPLELNINSGRGGQPLLKTANSDENLIVNSNPAIFNSRGIDKQHNHGLNYDVAISSPGDSNQHSPTSNFDQQMAHLPDNHAGNMRNFQSGRPLLTSGASSATSPDIGYGQAPSMAIKYMAVKPSVHQLHVPKQAYTTGRVISGPVTAGSFEFSAGSPNLGILTSKHQNIDATVNSHDESNLKRYMENLKQNSIANEMKSVSDAAFDNQNITNQNTQHKEDTIKRGSFVIN